MSTYYDQALQLHEQWQNDLKRVRSDGRLSTDGKRQELAPIYTRYTAALAAIQNGAHEATTRRADELKRQTFGVPSDPISAMSYRDALSRAEAIESYQVADYKLAGALETGDRLMAKAIARHADEMGWANVVERYTDATPGVSEALAELRAGETALMQNRFSEGIYFAPQRPDEFGNLHDHQIQALTDGTDPKDTAVEDLRGALTGEGR